MCRLSIDCLCCVYRLARLAEVSTRCSQCLPSVWGGGGGLLPLFFDHVDGSVDGSVVRRPSVNVISNVISIIA